MKRERVVVEDRRNKILEVLKKEGEIKIEELAKVWEVSPLTIRRDLQYLEEHKKIERFYGGAHLIQGEQSQQDELTIYRRLIAEYAANLVEDGDSIFINTSMTALNMVKYLGNKRVTVITNNANIMNIEIPLSVSVVLTGGELRYPKHALVGEFALKNLENVTVKKSFMGCSGLTVERGMTTEIMNEVHINKLMFEHVTDAAYILADHTKIGKNSSFVSQNIEKITHLITDEKVSLETIDQLKAYNISTYQVNKI